VKVKTPSRKSDWKCKITDKGEITLGFSLINGFGEIAHQELMDLLKQKGKRLDTISMTSFFELPFSKFNKSVFESALKAGVFDDWSTSREYLLNLKTKKKKKVADVAQRFLFDIEEVEISSMDSSKFQPTSQEDKLNQFIEVCRFNMDHIQRVSKVTNQINERASKKKINLDPLTKFSEDGLYYFFLNDIKRLTTKTGKMYLELIVGDGISKSKLRVFEPVATKILSELERGAFYVAEFVKKDDKYINLSRSAKFKKIVHSYSDELIS
jgi:DNA polymerase III alpha subunit